MLAGIRGDLYRTICSFYRSVIHDPTPFVATWDRPTGVEFVLRNAVDAVATRFGAPPPGARGDCPATTTETLHFTPRYSYDPTADLVKDSNACNSRSFRNRALGMFLAGVFR